MLVSSVALSACAVLILGRDAAAAQPKLKRVQKSQLKRVKGRDAAAAKPQFKRAKKAQSRLKHAQRVKKALRGPAAKRPAREGAEFGRLREGWGEDGSPSGDYEYGSMPANEEPDYEKPDYGKSGKYDKGKNDYGKPPGAEFGRLREGWGEDGSPSGDYEYGSMPANEEPDYEKPGKYDKGKNDYGKPPGAEFGRLREGWGEDGSPSGDYEYGSMPANEEPDYGKHDKGKYHYRKPPEGDKKKPPVLATERRT